MENSLSSVLKASARVLIRKDANKIFLTSLIYLLIISVISFLSTRLPGTFDPQNFYDQVGMGSRPEISLIYREFRPLGAFLALLLCIFQPVLDFGFLSFCINIARGQDSEYKDLIGGFKLFAKIITIFLVSLIFIFLWSLLLIIPGIVAAYRYRLAYYVLLDDPRKSALQCIEESVILIRGGKLDLFLIDLSFLGWYLLDFMFLVLLPVPFPVRILMIWVLPYRGITNAIFYERRRSSLAA